MTWRSLHAWTVHNASILDAIRGMSQNVIVISCQDLMQGHVELDRLSSFVGRPLVDVRRTEQYRQRQTTSWQTTSVDWMMRRLGSQGQLQTFRALGAVRDQQAKAFCAMASP